MRKSWRVPIVVALVLAALVALIWLKGDLLMQWLLALHGKH